MLLGILKTHSVQNDAVVIECEWNAHVCSHTHTHTHTVNTITCSEPSVPAVVLLVLMHGCMLLCYCGQHHPGTNTNISVKREL